MTTQKEKDVELEHVNLTNGHHSRQGSTDELLVPSTQDNNSKKSKTIIIILFIVTSIIILAIGIGIGYIIGNKNIHTTTIEPKTQTQTTSNIKSPIFDYKTSSFDKSLYGQWEIIIPSNVSATVGPLTANHAVNAILLPSGKIIISNGNGLRIPNRKSYPFYDDGSGGQIPFQWWPWPEVENVSNINNIENYYERVNNMAIYDIDKNTYFRIPHPRPLVDENDNSKFVPNDMFCVGQQHLFDGNVFFFGGTEFGAVPSWTGSKTTKIFNWTKELEIDWENYDWTQLPNITDNTYPWIHTPNMVWGRWYTHAVPTMDGKLIILGGAANYDTDGGIYPWEMNHWVDIFDYRIYLSNNYTYISEYFNWENLNNKKNNPFTRLLENDGIPPIGKECLPKRDTLIGKDKRECDDYQTDTLKMYPHIYLMPDNRIYFTREGDWSSPTSIGQIRTRRSKYSYFINITGTTLNPKVTFQYGPNLTDFAKSGGNTVRDPNGNYINRFGGMPMLTSGVLYPGLISHDLTFTNITNINNTKPMTNIASQYVFPRGSREFERFTIPEKSNDIGSWKMEDINYLGDTHQDDRTQHYTVILPTKQLLIINGGNYMFGKGTTIPLLLTPIYNDKCLFTGNYTRLKLVESIHERLYHNTALLLPNGKIFIAGGQGGLASVIENEPQTKNYTHSEYSKIGQQTPNLERFNLQSFIGLAFTTAYGHYPASAENWYLEMFSPPYIFIDGNRQPIIKSICNGYTYNYNCIKIGVDNKKYYLMHSNTKYKIILNNLPIKCPNIIDCTSNKLVIIKLGASTHGWDSGQRLYNIKYNSMNGNEIELITPNFEKEQIIPAFYHLFFIDCMGKPTHSIMVRFDDKANSPF